MTPAELRAVFLDELVNVAPDIDPATVGEDDHIQDDLDLDSMDVLNLVAALHARLGVDIPEADYPRIATPRLAVAFLGERAAQAGQIATRLPGERVDDALGPQLFGKA